MAAFDASAAAEEQRGLLLRWLLPVRAHSSHSWGWSLLDALGGRLTAACENPGASCPLKARVLRGRAWRGVFRSLVAGAGNKHEGPPDTLPWNTGSTGLVTPVVCVAIFLTHKGAALSASELCF